MSGVSYQPPTNILPSFNTNEFTNTSSTLSVAKLISYTFNIPYLKDQ